MAEGILEALAETEHPDAALAAFDRFLSGLPAGVQIFSLFNANPQLLSLIARICTAAPKSWQRSMPSLRP